MLFASLAVALAAVPFHPSAPAPVEPPPEDSGDGAFEWQRSLEQFGIRWTFTKPHKTGRFATGDWWVVGPVSIAHVSPATVRLSNGRDINGSMINPSPRQGTAQGYDSAMYGQYATAGTYDESLNVGWLVSESHPLVVPPHSSLVSTRSVSTAGARPQIDDAAILTVLDDVPPPGAFRPAYSGTDKTVRYTLSQLDRSRLLDLAPVPRPAPVAATLRQIERPWLDHVPSWLSTYIHPAQNMPEYGREIADQVGVASLILNLDLPASATDPLLFALVQIGIDFYGILEDGGENNWQSGGGHHSGRKWPILFAGMMLGDRDMASIGFDPTLIFMGEDGQTFFVEETSEGVYNYGYGGYGREQLGLPEWGNKHALDPSLDESNWFVDPYRRCCTANSWTGIVLAARMMGAVELWNHPALFAYQDRYVAVTNQVGGSVATSFFTLDMWNRYRSQF